MGGGRGLNSSKIPSVCSCAQCDLGTVISDCTGIIEAVLIADHHQLVLNLKLLQCGLCAEFIHIANKRWSTVVSLSTKAASLTLACAVIVV